jgi:hypothetical protein
VLVPIEPPAEPALRVVQVEGDDAPDADRRVERGHRAVVSGGRAEVVAGGERVLRVEAEPEPVAVARLGAQAAELLEAPADLRPLPGRVLERERRREAAARAEHLAERAHGGTEPRVVPRAAVRPRVGDEVRDAELLAALELGDQLADGALPEGLVGRGGVVEVRVVRAERADAGRLTRRREGAHLVLRDRPRRPLARRAREDLHRLAAGFPSALERAMEAARDRLVRAEERRRPSPHPP